MRIDRMTTRAALAALLLLPLPAALAAQADGAASAPRAAEATTERPVFTGDHTVGEGETVAGIVVVGGDLTVRGRVKGDAVVVGGDLLMEEGGTVTGDALITGGEVVNHGGTVFGEMRALGSADGGLSGDIERAVGSGVMAGVGSVEVSDRMARHISEPHRTGWFDRIGRGFAGLISTLAFGLVLAGIGAVLVFYGRPYLETVSDTLRASTLRAGAVGVAAGFLVIPFFVVLLVALAVTIIGIPLMVAVVPLYPLAIAAATGFGLLAAAHAIGERTAEQRSGFDRRSYNSYSHLFTGLGMLIAPLLAAHLLAMTGFLGFIGTLLKVVTWTVIWAAATAGFGAVILSRAGTRRTFVAPPPPEAGYDEDSLFADEPAGGTHV